VLLMEPGGNFVSHKQGIFHNVTVGGDPIYAVEVQQGTYDFIFLPNCRSFISQAFPSGIAASTTRAQILEKLEVYIADQWIVYDEDDPDPAYIPMPMWGEKKNASVSPDGAEFTDTNSVPVVRLTARIDIKLDRIYENSTYSKYYKLHSARLYNRRARARLIPDEQNYDFYYTSKWNFSLYGPTIPQTNNAKLKTPLYYDIPEEYETAYEAKIYTFETEAKDAVSPNDQLEYTCLVLGMGLDKNPGGGSTRGYHDETKYYRVDFIDSNTGEYVPLLRNHNYVVHVKDLTDHFGFPDPDQAYRSESYGITYQIYPWEAYYEEFEFDGGVYRLDISETSLDARMLSSVYFDVVTTHPNGIDIYTSKYPDRIEPAEYLTIIRANDTDASIEHNPEWLRNFELLGLLPRRNYTVQVASEFIPTWTYVEYIHVVSGNLTNVITVTIKDPGANR
ncbi:MAG: hypothetical protein LUE10_06225, partial [Alistipes sp.]|nr:hypothetical protein [Alistipes sp.]